MNLSMRCQGRVPDARPSMSDFDNYIFSLFMDFFCKPGNQDDNESAKMKRYLDQYWWFAHLWYLIYFSLNIVGNKWN